MPAFDFNPKNYPNNPGCYLMKDGSGTVIYVGKAKNLRKRVSSYFHKGYKRRYILNMVRRIRDIEVLIVDNETESLILETNLIRRYRPDTNRAKMGMTSGYPYIVLTDERYPRFVPFRKFRVNRDLGDEGIALSARRFGPYLNSYIRDTLLDFVNENFQIRTCYPMPKEVCLRYHLKTCGGICEHRSTGEAYAEQVNQAVRFLSLKHTHIMREMRERMMDCADQELFIRAGKIRDQLAVMDIALQKQIVERDVDYDQDVIYFGQGDLAHHALVMTIKQGMLWEIQLMNMVTAVSQTSVQTGTHTGNQAGTQASRQTGDQPVAVQGSSQREAQPITADGIATEFLLQRYATDAPKELITNSECDLQAVSTALSHQNGYRVRLVKPCRGVKADLLRLGEENFRYRASLLPEQ